MTSDRTIELVGVRNARHLGGIPFEQGGSTTSFDVIRSGSLHGLTAAGIDQLDGIGVRTVIDFRTDSERADRSTPVLEGSGIRMIPHPIFDIDPAPIGVETETGHAGYTWMYQHFLESGKQAYRAAFGTIASCEGPLLFHCAGGQDRTGLAAALFLSLAGVAAADILADHGLSRSVEGLMSHGIARAQAEQMTAAPVGGMTDALNLLKERWGSTEGYLQEAGLSAADISAVRARATG